MYQKKKILLFSVILVLILILASSFVYAAINDYYNNQATEEETKLEIASTVNNTLAALGEKQNIKASDISLNTSYDKYKDAEFYTLKTENYKFKINSSTNEISNIFINNYNFKSSSKATEDMARDYITSIYNKLNLHDDYELMYLQPFSTDTLWEADFQKNYDGVYNMYEAVKAIFDPATKEIVSLTVFDEKYDENIQLENANLNEETRKPTNSLYSIDITDGEDCGTTFIKPSTLAENNLDDNNIYKAKAVKKVTKNRTTISYFDYYTNEYLGGDMVL